MNISHSSQEATVGVMMISVVAGARALHINDGDWII